LIKHIIDINDVSQMRRRIFAGAPGTPQNLWSLCSSLNELFGSTTPSTVRVSYDEP